ncbi:MAG: rhomboid family intramembrane serine protease [Thermodesulfovibrionales bacterium]|jgi:membrane associated rhomboid family serine protease|nr:rhomboid family intramembrane serine protease [Thermodesulfovibrionales bacterium]
MIPLSDVDRRPLHFPVITALIIGANVLVFMLELAKGENFIMRWSLIPSEIASGRNLITMLTAMFIHGGWLHIIGNMVYFWAFGPEIEEAMGRIFYPVFYLSGGLVATLAQVAMNPASSIPNLGASGAIAAVMGAFLVTFPHDRIRTVILLGWFVFIRFIPATILVGFWFAIQLFSEVGAVAQRQTGGGVAYMAHIGGFVFGMALARLFESRHRRAEHGI